MRKWGTVQRGAGAGARSSEGNCGGRGGESLRQEPDRECRMLRSALFQTHQVLLSGGQHEGCTGRNRDGGREVSLRSSQLSRHETLRLKARGRCGACIQWNMTQP